MKDTEIHNGLPEKEIRDFFSESIGNLVKPSDMEKKSYGFDRDDPFKNQIENLKMDLTYIQNEIKRCEHLRSVITLIKSKGWEEHDCSDYVSKTGEYWKSFIGTTKEFEKFMKDNDFK